MVKTLSHKWMTIYPPPTSPLKGGGSRFDEDSSISDNLFPLPITIGKGGVITQEIKENNEYRLTNNE